MHTLVFIKIVNNVNEAHKQKHVALFVELLIAHLSILIL